jgi:prepilin-type N-terminal cleavage/methylation domain-containing protein
MRKAFTLIEILITTILTSLLMLVLYGTIDNLRQSNTFYEKKLNEFDEKNKALTLLRNDIMDARKFTLLDNDPKNYSVLSLETQSSIYGIECPYVTWLVMKKGKKLIRLESAFPITLPLDPKYLHLVHLDTIGDRYAIFKVMKQQEQIIITLKQESHEPIITNLIKEGL